MTERNHKDRFAGKTPSEIGSMLRMDEIESLTRQLMDNPKMDVLDKVVIYEKIDRLSLELGFLARRKRLGILK